MGAEGVIRTVCPRNCYCTCGMLVTVREGRVCSIQGDPLNPATGGRVCLKGLSYVQRQDAPDRLLEPLRRTPSGDFEAVAWETALDEIAGRLRDVRSRHGSRSLLFWEGSGSHGALSILSEAFWRPFGGITRLHGDLCWPAGLEATRLTYGENRHSHPRLTTDARFILLWGHNPAETNVHQMRLIQEAQTRGARLAVVDPRSTDTSDAADIHLQPRPGTDAALALALAHVIMGAGLHDRAFLDAHAEGFEAYAARVADWTPERAAVICGVPADAIRGLALAYAENGPALLIAGFGLQRNRHAGQTMRAVALLPALTGNIGKPGAGWQYANLISHRLREPALPPPPDPPDRSFPVARLGRVIEETADPPIRAAWFQMGNPVSQHPASDRVARALAGLDLVVVSDQFLTPTAQCADYVLPAKTLFEEEDLVTAYWHPYLQLRQQVAEPPAGVRPESAVWEALVRRFEFDGSLFETPREDVLRSMLPAERPGLLDALREGPVVPGDDGDIAFEDLRFPTPSGKIEFSSADAADLWGVDPLPDYQQLEEGHGSDGASRFPLQLLTCKTRERIHSQFGNLGWIRAASRPQTLDIHPQDASARGLRDGSRARLYNDRGSVELLVRLDAGIRPGVVHVIEGRCGPADPDLNRLTSDGVTDMNHGAVFYECLVEAERA